VAINPTMERGVVAVGDETCGTIAVVDSGGVHPLNLMIGAGMSEWNLAAFFGDRSSGCASQGRAAWPTWSLDDVVAFFASPQSVGASGLEKTTHPWNIYTWAPGENRVRELFGDVALPTGLAWAPGEQWLAFTGEIDGEFGLWLTSSQGDDPILVTTDAVFAFAWAPSGRSIAATVPLRRDDPSLMRVIVTYDVARLVN
jgi:hypothetical protein